MRRREQKHREWDRSYSSIMRSFSAVFESETLYQCIFYQHISWQQSVREPWVNCLQKSGEATGDCSKLHNEELHNLCCSANTGQLKKKVTLSHVYNEATSEPAITRFSTIVRKTLKVCNWRGKVFRAAAAREDCVKKWRLHSKRSSGYRTPFAKLFPASITNQLWEFS
jgi:hypothetical protein